MIKKWNEFLVENYDDVYIQLMNYMNIDKKNYETKPSNKYWSKEKYPWTDRSWLYSEFNAFIQKEYGSSYLWRILNKTYNKEDLYKDGLMFIRDKFPEFYGELKKEADISIEESLETINEWRGTIGNIGNVYLKLDNHGGLIFIKGTDREVLHLNKNEIYKLYKILKPLV